MKFPKSVKGEIGQVTRSSRKQFRRDTLVVIGTSIIFGLMFYVTDTAIQNLFDWILK